ncbi:MAG: cob(I)yrinic acid a,c-diamide adenosyltransferase [Myxococcota bacterium]
MKKGYTQVYTGDGKGKTTAALGLALRAVGAGLKVFIGQFVKGLHSSELESLKRLQPEIEIARYGRDRFIVGAPEREDIALAQKGLAEIKEKLLSGKYDVIVADEINIAARLKLITIDEILSLIESKPEGVELILTGRNADERVIEKADLVTEMRLIKHYYDAGVEAREGIES